MRLACSRMRRAMTHESVGSSFAGIWCILIGRASVAILFQRVVDLELRCLLWGSGMHGPGHHGYLKGHA
jgi:hypothetical protein